MSQTAIRSELINTPMQGHYEDGRPWQETYFVDHTITYQDSSADWTGEWSFRGSGFCTFYNDGRNGGCWQIIKSGSNCYYFYALQRSGKPFSSKPNARQNWTARGWRKNAASSCDVDVSS